MIKITVKTIEVNKEEFIEEVEKLCGDLYRYLGIVYLTRERFNQHFKTKLNDLEFAKLMDDHWFEIENINKGIGVRIDIVKLLKSLK